MVQSMFRNVAHLCMLNTYCWDLLRPGSAHSYRKPISRTLSNLLDEFATLGDHPVQISVTYQQLLLHEYLIADTGTSTVDYQRLMEECLAQYLRMYNYPWSHPPVQPPRIVQPGASSQPYGDVIDRLYIARACAMFYLNYAAFWPDSLRRNRLIVQIAAALYQEVRLLAKTLNFNSRGRVTWIF